MIRGWKGWIRRFLVFVKSISCSWYERLYFGAIAAICWALSATAGIAQICIDTDIAASIVCRQLTINHPYHPPIILPALKTCTGLIRMSAPDRTPQYYMPWVDMPDSLLLSAEAGKPLGEVPRHSTHSSVFLYQRRFLRPRRHFQHKKKIYRNFTLFVVEKQNRWLRLLVELRRNHVARSWSLATTVLYPVTFHRS